MEETTTEVQNQLPYLECIKVFCAMQEQTFLIAANRLFLEGQLRLKHTTNRQPLSSEPI